MNHPFSFIVCAEEICSGQNLLFSRNVFLRGSFEKGIEVVQPVFSIFDTIVLFEYRDVSFDLALLTALALRCRITFVPRSVRLLSSLVTLELSPVYFDKFFGSNKSLLKCRFGFEDPDPFLDESGSFRGYLGRVGYISLGLWFRLFGSSSLCFVSRSGLILREFGISPGLLTG